MSTPRCAAGPSPARAATPTARIFTTCLEPQLVSIAGIYRTTEDELPADVLGKPAQVWLDGDSLVVEPPLKISMQPSAAGFAREFT
jgi:hypothetical protein